MTVSSRWQMMLAIAPYSNCSFDGNPYSNASTRHSTAGQLLEPLSKPPSSASWWYGKESHGGASFTGNCFRNSECPCGM